MSRPVTHIIHKLNLDIEVPDERLARRMYARAGSLLQEHVLPRLEELLKAFDREDLHVRLDTLEIELDIEKGHAVESTLKNQMAKAIAKKLEAIAYATAGNKALKDPEETRIHTTASIVQAFLFFLEKGYLPWWVEDRSGFSESQFIINAITVAEDKFVPVFIRLIKDNPVALARLLQQYDHLILSYLFSLLVPLDLFSLVVRQEAVLEKILHGRPDMETLLRQYWQQVWTIVPANNIRTLSPGVLEIKLQEIILTLTSANNSTAYGADHTFALITEPVQSVWGNAAQDDRIQPVSRKQEAVSQKEEEETVHDKGELFAGNVGLILLHPFLQFFFAELGLLEADRFKDEEARAVAVHLLHYMATGREQAPDFDLLFEKYLCGMETGQVTNRYGMLTTKMKDEARTVLEAVLKHWSVLKSTSTEGLQEGFLQRRGKLMISESGHRIMVEQSALDILLQQIPWNISLVKLPWLKQLIHVEWVV